MHACRSTLEDPTLTNAGREREALAAADSAIARARSTGSVPDLVFSRISRAELLLRLGEPAACLALIDSLRAQVESIGDEDLALQLLIPECAARLDLAQYDAAEAKLRPAIEALERRRDRQGAEASRLGVMLKLGELYAALARSCVEQGRIAEGWSVVERGRAPLLRDRLDPGGAAITLERLQARLRETDAVLVQFNDPTLSPIGAFVVTPDSCRFVALPEATSLSGDAAAAATRMAGGAPDADLSALLERLSAGLLQPVLPFLPVGSKHLFWVPPVSLSGFPVEALPWPDGAGGFTTAAERIPMAYLPAASALELLERQPAGREVIVLADPELAVPADSGLVATTVRALAATPLPYARREARSIAPPASQVHLGRYAGRSTLAGASRQDAAVLHFATHALINSVRPERSALLLAGADGLLTAADVESLGLRADLVVLSGCRTGGGLTALGEGTLGLARSFLAAGSRSVVMSLWDVEDRAASRFMEMFYDGLRDGASRAAALEGARQRLRDEGFPRRDWGAFVLTGSGDRPVAAIAGTPKPGMSSRPMFVVGAGALLLAAAGLFLFVRRNGGRTGGPARQ